MTPATTSSRASHSLPSLPPTSPQRGCASIHLSISVRLIRPCPRVLKAGISPARGHGVDGLLRELAQRARRGPQGNGPGIRLRCRATIARAWTLRLRARPPCATAQDATRAGFSADRSSPRNSRARSSSSSLVCEPRSPAGARVGAAWSRFLSQGAARGLLERLAHEGLLRCWRSGSAGARGRSGAVPLRLRGDACAPLRTASTTVPGQRGGHRGPPLRLPDLGHGPRCRAPARALADARRLSPSLQIRRGDC
jgi:hypothetical protein